MTLDIHAGQAQFPITKLALCAHEAAVAGHEAGHTDVGNRQESCVKISRERSPGSPQLRSCRLWLGEPGSGAPRLPRYGGYGMRGGERGMLRGLPVTALRLPFDTASLSPGTPGPRISAGYGDELAKARVRARPPFPAQERVRDARRRGRTRRNSSRI